MPEYRFNNKSYKSKQKLISHRASWKMIEKEAEKLNHIIKKRIENKKAWDEVLSITCPFLKSIPNNSKVMGYPAKNIREFLKESR